MPETITIEAKDSDGTVIDFMTIDITADVTINVQGNDSSA